MRAAQARKNNFDDLELKASMEEPMANLSAAVTEFLATIRKNILTPEKADGLTPLTVTGTKALSETFQFVELARSNSIVSS